MRTIISIILILIATSSCSLEKKLEKYCPLCQQKDSTVTIYRDTTIEIPGETVFMTDTLSCDSLGNVISKLNGIIKDKSGRIISLQRTLNNNVYTVKASVDTVYKVIKGNTIYREKVRTIHTPKEIEYRIPWWAIFLSVCGAIAIIFLTLYLIKK